MNLKLLYKELRDLKNQKWSVSFVDTPSLPQEVTLYRVAGRRLVILCFISSLDDGLM